MKASSEELFVATSATEHTEMYLKAVKLIHERGEDPARINITAELLKVAAPSVVQMLKRLHREGYLHYLPRRGVSLTRKGLEIGDRMIRNTRLAETLMYNKLSIRIDKRVACGIEHHMTDTFSEALCTLLGHPATCPHGLPIPRGKCCKEDGALQRR